MQIFRYHGGEVDIGIAVNYDRLYAADCIIAGISNATTGLKPRHKMMHDIGKYRFNF
jgi:hypothetical protein